MTAALLSWPRGSMGRVQGFRFRVQVPNNSAPLKGIHRVWGSGFRVQRNVWGYIGFRVFRVQVPNN